MTTQVTTIKLKDDNNTVVFCNPGDDLEKARKLYEEKLINGNCLRFDKVERHNRRTNNKHKP